MFRSVDHLQEVNELLQTETYEYVGKLGDTNKTIK
jgi:hypothetical protein